MRLGEDIQDRGDYQHIKKFNLRYDSNVLVISIWDFYVDVFMIWLLYKFRNPKAYQADSCILYAHDHAKASE